MKRREIATIGHADESSRASIMASSTLTPTMSANSSGDARSSSRRVVPGTRKPYPKKAGGL